MGGLSVLTIQLDLRVPWEFPEQLEENAWLECRKAIASGFHSQMWYINELIPIDLHLIRYINPI